MGVFLTATQQVSLVLYLLLLVCVVTCMILSATVYRRATIHLATRYFLRVLLLFTICRVVWLLIQDKSLPRDLHFVINRLAWACFFAAFSLIVFFWADVYQSITSTRIAGGLMRWRTFLIINAGLVFIQGCFTVALLAHSDLTEEEENNLYDGNVLTLAVISFVGAIAFLVYGWRMLRKTMDLLDGTGQRTSYMAKIMISTSIFVLSFGSRVVVFSYRPATHKFLPEVVFTTFAYLIPELIPSFWELYLIMTQRIKSHDSKSFQLDTTYSPLQSGN